MDVYNFNFSIWNLLAHLILAESGAGIREGKIRAMPKNTPKGGNMKRVITKKWGNKRVVTKNMSL